MGRVKFFFLFLLLVVAIRIIAFIVAPLVDPVVLLVGGQALFITAFYLLHKKRYEYLGYKNEWVEYSLFVLTALLPPFVLALFLSALFYRATDERPMKYYLEKLFVGVVAVWVGFGFIHHLFYADLRNIWALPKNMLFGAYHLYEKARIVEVEIFKPERGILFDDGDSLTLAVGSRYVVVRGEKCQASDTICTAETVDEIRTLRNNSPKIADMQTGLFGWFLEVVPTPQGLKRGYSEKYIRDFLER